MKKIKLYIIILTLGIFWTQLSHAQYALFPDFGNIKFEKTVYYKNLMRKQISYLGDNSFMKPFYDNLYRTISESAVHPANMAFRKNESYYEYVEKEQPNDIKNAENMVRTRNSKAYYHNLDAKLSKQEVSSPYFEGVIEDSLLNIKWKITDEYRSIAGYECRRANGVILDSIYVVAFFTDQIPVSSGPENFHGLPGMILGVSVPDLNYTIYATEIKIEPAQIKTEMGNRRSSKSTRKKLLDDLERIVKSYNPSQRLEFLGRLFI